MYAIGLNYKSHAEEAGVCFGSLLPNNTVLQIVTSLATKGVH